MRMLGYMPLLAVIMCVAFMNLHHTHSTAIELVKMNPRECLRSNTSTPIYLNEHAYYEVVWNGTELLPDCQLVFKGAYHDGTKEEEHKVRVYSVDYSITNCSFKLEIRQSPDKLMKEKSCGFTKLEEICTYWGKPLILRFVNTNVTGSNTLSLLIGSDRNEHHISKKKIGVIVGVTVGVVVPLVVIVIVCVVRHKQKRLRYQNGNPCRNEEKVDSAMDTKLSP